MERVIYYDRPAKEAATLDLLTRRRYRKEFGLTAQEMDDEPVAEVNYMMKIFYLEDKRSEYENKKAMRQNSSVNNHG
ncbi:MAG: hypothetical protein D8B38_01030 [Candidatus Saccharimonas sp.]|nr:MAG: hypothetical protein D8B38_01030 [Candidatus Saccharimonas sp.]DAQ42058.1 MAG TPA: hypothetical protein [Caudoviricetes sp.]